MDREDHPRQAKEPIPEVSTDTAGAGLGGLAGQAAGGSLKRQKGNSRTFAFGPALTKPLEAGLGRNHQAGMRNPPATVTSPDPQRSADFMKASWEARQDQSPPPGRRTCTSEEGTGRLKLEKAAGTTDLTDGRGSIKPRSWRCIRQGG